MALDTSQVWEPAKNLDQAEDNVQPPACGQHITPGRGSIKRTEETKSVQENQETCPKKRAKQNPKNRPSQMEISELPDNELTESHKDAGWHQEGSTEKSESFNSNRNVSTKTEITMPKEHNY